MKKFLLSTAILILVLAVVSGQTFAVYNTISVNFIENTSNQAFSGGQYIGPLSTNSSFWNSSINPTTGDKVAGTIVNLIDAVGAPTGINIEWISSNCWYNYNDGTGDDQHKLAVGYLDDGDPNNTGKGVSVKFTNIPYDNYKIIGLYSSDQGDTSMVNFDVNGTWVLGGDNKTKAIVYGSITTCYNATGNYWVQIVPEVTRGNYWVVDATGSTCTITGELKSGTSRGCLAGVVILTEEKLPAPQRSISHNFQYEASVDGWGYHFYLSRSSNSVFGYDDPNGLYNIQQVPAGTWNEGVYITDTYLAKDYFGETGSAIAVHSADNVWDSSWYLNVDGYFAGSPIANLDPGDPTIVENAKNKARVSQAWLVQNAVDPKEPLTSLKRVPYGKYTVVTYMHPNHFDSLDEIQIEDQARFYLSQHGGGAYAATWETDPYPDGFKWNVARDTTPQGGWLIASPDANELTAQRANVAIFQDLTAPDMVLYFDAHGSNSGISAYSLISEVDGYDVVTQITPGNINKDYGDMPASKDTTVLSWDAPENGADSYDVYLGEYGAGVPSLVEAGNTTGSYTPALEYNKTYVWRVDTVRDSETFTGDYFYFDVEGSPVIMGQPRSVAVKEGGDTFFAIDAVLVDNCAWYYSPDAANDTIEDDTLLQSGPDAQVDIANVAPEDVGYYYVVLTNALPGSEEVVSDVASLEIGRLELYLPFDGEPNDISGNDWLVLPGNRIVDANGVYIGPSAGTISYQTGYDGIGQAAKFTRGSGDQLEVIDSDSYFNFYTKGFTIRFWVKPTYGQGGYLTYIAKSSNAWNPPASGWRMYDEGEYASQGYSANMSPLTYNTPLGRLDDGNWHMVGCTYNNATQEMKVYQNGVLQGTLTGLLGPTTVYPLVIGNQYKDGTGGWGYEGLLDDIEIFSYAATEYEMLNDYATKTGLELCFGSIAGDVNDDCKVDIQDLSDMAPEWLETTNPDTPPMTRVVSWQFDETSGMTAADSSGNGIKGILGAGFANDADAQWIIDGGRTGTIGDNALFFNGDPNTSVISDSNSISLPFANGAGNVFDATSSWTINLWIKFVSEYAASQMVNIGGFGYNEWPSDPDPDGNSDRYFASYAGGYEFEVGQDGLWPSNPLGADWTMMTATYDGTTCTVYYNGQQVSQMDVALVDAIEEINLNTARRVLWDYDNITVPMNATIDDFSIWSEAFGAVQILGMYENGFPSCDGMLVGDINGDCDVNMDDFLLVVDTWLECNRIPESLCQ